MKSLDVDVSATDSLWRGVLREIGGSPNSVTTSCALRRQADMLHIAIDAQDDNMLELVATAPRQGQRDDFLYEEDCIQLAIAPIGETEATGFLLINPCGNFKATGEALGWTADTSRYAQGWRIEITLPLPHAPAVGLSLHRFFRGIHDEVHGLTNNLPHPLDTSAFAVLVLQQGADVAAAAVEYREAVQAAQQQRIEQKLSCCRQTIARRQELPSPWTKLAARLALERAAIEVRPQTQFLCWNEAYFQNALIDLWELQRDTRWLELAIERVEATWSMTGERRGEPAALWNEMLPTWYDHADELGTAITLMTGTILYPIARLFHTITMDASLESFRPRIRDWIEPCRRAIAVHDREWIELEAGTGFYLEPYMKGLRRVYPTGGSRIAPLNRGIYLAIPLVYLGKALGDQTYIERATKMARFWRQAWQITPHGNPVWEYQVSRYPSTGEDISHAHAQVLFTELCCREGIEFIEADLERLAATYEKCVFRFGDVPCEYVRGTEPGLNAAVAAWSSLCRFASHLMPHVVAVTESFYTADPQWFSREGWGIRLLTSIEKARREVEKARREVTVRQPPS